MTSDIAVELISTSLRLVMLLVTVLVLPGLIVGLLVGLFQAATQINEQTMSFLPRLLITLFTVTIAGHWIASRLMEYCISVFQRAGTLVH